MIKIFSFITFILLFISGCFTPQQKEVIKDNRVELGDIKINYYSDKSVNSLEIPPDLTQLSYENSFRLSEFVNDVDANTVNLSNNPIENEKSKDLLVIPSNIEVKKSGNRRWLVVEKSPDVIWDLSKQFLKEQGFVIKKINKSIGTMETDFLENKPDIPERSLGMIRSFFASTVENVSYTLPSIDKYKIRIEPLGEKKSEVYLSLSSMAEVITGSGSNETTLWQEKDKDLALETEMLYLLMTYLGSDAASAREKISSAKEVGKIPVSLANGLNGYAKLVFKINMSETWDNLAWAISELNINLEDKDIKEKTFYIRESRDSDKGIMSSIFGDDAIQMVFQLSLKETGKDNTEVYFHDVSETNEKETKEYSYQLFKKIQKLF